MPRKGENIYKRKDGRWEGRYIGCYDENHKAKYVYIYGKTYTEVKQKLAIERGRQKQHVPAEKKQITYAARADEFNKAICYIHILVSERRKIVYQDKYSGQRRFTDGMEVNKCAAIVISKETLALVDDIF